MFIFQGLPGRFIVNILYGDLDAAAAGLLERLTGVRGPHLENRAVSIERVLYAGLFSQFIFAILEVFTTN